MSKRSVAIAMGAIALGFCVVAIRPSQTVHADDDFDHDSHRGAASPAKHAEKLIAEGRQTFRFDTFGDEDFWGGTLQLHKAVEGAKLGGVGPGLSPVAALTAGLKVDMDALPRGVREQICPASTISSH